MHSDLNAESRGVMSDFATSSSVHQNRLLAALPYEDLERLRPYLVAVTLEYKTFAVQSERAFRVR